MSDLGYAQAVALGVVQGLTEFLPISSSAHLALTQRWMGLKPDGAAMLLFDVLAHLGTLAAVLIVFAASIRRFAVRCVAECRGAARGRIVGWRIVGTGAVATAVTGGIGLGFQKTFESAFDRPTWIAVGLLITGALLGATAGVRRPRRSWRRWGGWQALVVGLAQGLAILPGISRSGATICTALFLGLRRRWAGQFSFLIAVPAILAATGLKILETAGAGEVVLPMGTWGPVLVGSLVSFIVGMGALVVLLRIVERAQLHYFAVYCLAMGVFVLWMTAGRG